MEAPESRPAGASSAAPAVVAVPRSVIRVGADKSLADRRIKVGLGRFLHPAMSQLFPRSANATARMSLAALLVLVLTGGWVVFTLMRSGWVTKQHEIV